VVESAGSVLEVRGLDVWHGRVQVLFGLDLDVAPGEVVAVLGTNGAGKTTLLRAISGLVSPAAGSIRLDGDDLTRVCAEDRARRGVVQVRGADVFAGLTVDENLRAAVVAHPAPRREAGRRVERVYDVFAALATHRRQDAASLSGGEQQMVALGCACCSRRGSCWSTSCRSASRRSSCSAWSTCSESCMLRARRWWWWSSR
jgi:branched-chain amino acid transport system ATP-binding protein